MKKEQELYNYLKVSTRVWHFIRPTDDHRRYSNRDRHQKLRSLIPNDKMSAMFAIDNDVLGISKAKIVNPTRFSNSFVARTKTKVSSSANKFITDDFK